MRASPRQSTILGSLVAAALLAACGGGGGSSADAGSGTLSVGLTDAPACGYDQVNVTVSKVRAHQSSSASENDDGWSEIVLNPARKINLLNLTNGVLDGLGQTTLPAGRYTQLRLVLSPNGGATPLANSVVPSGGTETALVTPSGITSGVKLNANFDVAANTTTDLTLDFDACKSIVTRGNGSYGLKPVIGVIPMVSSGAVNGVIDPQVAVAGKSLVNAQVNGVIVRSTVPAANGSFSLSPLPAGSYTIVMTADARTTGVITGVPVTAKATTAISTSAAPTALPVSATNAVSGNVLPADAEGTVTASQSFASGATVAIKYQNADVLSGAYSLTLPTAAPLLGQYGTLPINLAAQTAVAGKYAVAAAASGYQAQSAAVDISAGAATKNFTLVK